MLEKIFKLKSHNTTLGTEFMGGITTFLAMAYILFVNANILADAGMDPAAVFAATAIAAIVGSLIMGLYANLPIAVAPGMGMNAFFAYVIVLKYGYTYQDALAATLIAGIIFFFISISGLRAKVITAIPESLKIAVGVGIGFFITFIGLQEAGIIVPDPATFITLGDLTNPTTLLALFGLVITIVLMARKFKGAVFFGIVATAIVGIITNLAPLPTGILKIPGTEIASLFGVAITNIPSFVTTGSIVNVIVIIFVLLFVDFFDTAGTIVSVTRAAGLVDDKGDIKNGNRAFMADSVGTVAGAVVGTNTTTSYIESLAGISVGARTGLATVFTALCFFIFLFFSPLLSIIIPAVTAPALIIVGSLMSKEVAKIDYSDFPAAIGAFMTMLLILLSYNISKGLAFGFLIYTIAMVAAGRFKEVPVTIYVLDVFFVLMLFFTL